MNERRARRIRVVRRARANDGLPTDIVAVTPHGRTMRVWNHTGKIVGCWRRGTVYERPLLESIRNAGYHGTAVDVGANLGNHTLWLAAVCGLRGVAFEPLEHRELRDNLALNPGLPVQVEPVALGAVEGTAEHVGAGRLVPEGDLPVRTLDSYSLTNVAVIKVDVEGMEPSVLRGGEATIRRDRPTIWAEEHDQAEHEAIAGVLEPWGYRMVERLAGRGQATPMGRWEAR